MTENNLRLDFFATAPDDEYEWLKYTINANPYSHYIFDDCILPDACSPNTATISITKENGGYSINCHENVSYNGNNPVLRNFFEDSTLHADNWDDFVKLCRQFIENDDPTPPEADNASGVRPGAEPLTFENLRDSLKTVVMGQDEAIETISFQVMRHLAKKNPSKPMSIMAYGPPGTGKSETAKALGRILSDNGIHEYNIIWTDLNTFNDAHTVYRLTGAPPGYVGYEDKPVFEAVAENPYTIFIFDELDKAHPEVLKTFMAVLDEGRCASRTKLRDGSREYNFKNSIFFFTSNYVLNGDKAPTNKIGFSVSEHIKGIEYGEGDIKVSYKEPKAKSEPDKEDITQRIYKNTERARKEFIKTGVLAEIASRFHAFVEYKPLSDEAKVQILAKQIIETGFEYGIRIGYISKDIIQGIVDIVSGGEALTVRSFKAVIEGRLVDVFTAEEYDENETYSLEGKINSPKLAKM